MLVRTLLLGILINAVWLPHAFRKDRRSWKRLATLLIPFAGLAFYPIFFVWEIPPPQPRGRQMSVRNDFGRTEWKERPTAPAKGIKPGGAERTGRIRALEMKTVKQVLLILFAALVFAAVLFGLWIR